MRSHGILLALAEIELEVFYQHVDRIGDGIVRQEYVIPTGLYWC